MLVGFNVTDEIFGISISVPNKLNPYYAFGADVVAMPGWALGTLTGGVLGAVLPARIVSALSVALYGMFIAIFIPPAKQNKVVFGTVAAGVLLSWIMTEVSFFSFIPEGIRIILLTVVISLAAAVLFPVKEENGNES